jgi:hypothetical protein
MSCGGASQHQVVCLDFISATGVDHNTTQQYVVVRYSTSSVAWGFNDDQTMTAYGTISAVWNFHMGTGSGTSTNVVVADAGVWLPVNFGVSPVYGFGAVISGQYLGGTPAHQIDWQVPARPPAPPGVPGVTVTAVTQTTANVNVTAPGDNGGAGIDAYSTEVWVNGAGGPSISWAGGSGVATGLTPGVTYAARAAAHNAAGWGAWSGFVYFTTIAGGRVKVGAAWQSAGAYVKAGPAWVRAVGVWKKAGGTWVR